MRSCSFGEACFESAVCTESYACFSRSGSTSRLMLGPSASATPHHRGGYAKTLFAAGEAYVGLDNSAPRVLYKLAYARYHGRLPKARRRGSTT